jgi:hypothetical protein
MVVVVVVVEVQVVFKAPTEKHGSHTLTGS